MSTPAEQIKAYVLAAVDNSSYEDKELTTDAERVAFLKRTFYSEYGHNVARMGEERAIQEWLQGLPSCMNIAFYNGDVIKLGVKWGLLKPNDDPDMSPAEIDFSNRYWAYLAQTVAGLFATVKE